MYVNWEIGFRFSFSSHDWIFALRDAEPIPAMDLPASIWTCIPLMAVIIMQLHQFPGFCFSCYVYTYDTGVAPRSRCLRMNGYLPMHSMRRSKHHCAHHIALIPHWIAAGCFAPTHLTDITTLTLRSSCLTSYSPRSLVKSSQSRLFCATESLHAIRLNGTMTSMGGGLISHSASTRRSARLSPRYGNLLAPFSAAPRDYADLMPTPGLCLPILCCACCR